MCDFLCVNNSNLPLILHRFRDTVDYLSNFCCRQRMPIFYALVRGKPLHSSQNLLEATKKLETSSIVWYEKYFDILNRLGVTHECVRPTDRQRYRPTDFTIASAVLH